MFLKMNTFDWEGGDEFDDYKFSAESYDDFLASVLARFEALLANRTLIIDREEGDAIVVEPATGQRAQSNITAYLSEQNLEADLNGLEIAGFFYSPDSKDLSDCFNEELFWDARDCFDAWGLSDIKEPPTDMPRSFDGDMAVTEYLFNLCQSRLEAK